VYFSFLISFNLFSVWFRFESLILLFAIRKKNTLFAYFRRRFCRHLIKLKWSYITIISWIAILSFFFSLGREMLSSVLFYPSHSKHRTKLLTLKWQILLTGQRVVKKLKVISFLKIIYEAIWGPISTKSSAKEKILKRPLIISCACKVRGRFFECLGIELLKPI